MNNKTKVTSPPEAHLRNELLKTLKKVKTDKNITPHILNIGAGQYTVIEDFLSRNNYDFTCDRIDVEESTATHPSFRNIWQCSVESMTPIDSNVYDAALANFVLEHVPDLRKAAQEIYRVLKPSGKFITTLPNPNAPEFILAKITPLWFHKIARVNSTHTAFETHYSYKSINDLSQMFQASGLNLVEVRYYPILELYLERLSPFMGKLGKIYDSMVASLNIQLLMGNVCIIFQKPE